MVKKNLREFDYVKTAKIDTDMWKAYYNHNFLWLFVLLLQLMRTQFQFDWLLAFRSAYHAAVAATNYRLRYGKDDFPVALKHLEKFYRLISRHATEPFDYAKAAGLELEWWSIHRYPTRYDKALGVSLAEAMATVYSSKPKNSCAMVTPGQRPWFCETVAKQIPTGRTSVCFWNHRGRLCTILYRKSAD